VEQAGRVQGGRDGGSRNTECAPGSSELRAARRGVGPAPIHPHGRHRLDVGVLPAGSNARPTGGPGMARSHHQEPARTTNHLRCGIRSLGSLAPGRAAGDISAALRGDSYRLCSLRGVWCRLACL